MINPDLNLGLLAGHNIWQSIIIFAVVIIILKVIKDTSAEEKSWSWTATLFALALLPMAAFLPGEGIKWQNETPAYQMESSIAAVIANQKISKNPAIVITSSADVFTKDRLIYALLGIWLLGMMFALGRLVLAGYNASVLRKTAYPYANNQKEWPEDIEVVISDDINGPIVIGIFQPMILIPRNFAYEMPVEELKPLLFHELAHIKRHDNLLHLFERIILSIYWWNPVMHFIVRRISQERELACDDRAIKSCGDQLAYAKSLLKGARQLMGQNKPILGLAVLRRESPLGIRVKRLTGTTKLGKFNIMRLIKNLSILSMSILCLGLITPRLAIGQVEPDETVVELDDDYMPSEEEIERIVEEAMAEMPSDDEMESMIEEAMAEMPSDDEMESMIEEAMEEMPTEAELVKIIAEAKASLPTEGEITRIIKEARAEMPSEEELAKIIEAAMASLPTEVDIARILEEAKAEMPTEEEIELMVKEAMVSIPSREEIEKMKMKIKEKMKKTLSDEQRVKMRRVVREKTEEAKK